jgi:predicted GNAT superfamily acetyltransferase
VPPDIEELRLRRPAAAQAWRTAVRSVLTELFAEGASLTGFDKAGFYVVRRDPRRSS